MTMLTRLFNALRALSLTTKLIGGAVIVVAIGVIAHASVTPAPAPTTSDTLTHVSLAPLGSLATQGTGLSITGTVTSLSKANILAQSSGEVTSLLHSLGDVVPAGAVIAYLQNASQQAAVLQAQGAYDAAEATLAKVTGSTAQNSQVTSAQAAQAAANAKIAAVTAIQNAAASLDDAIHTKADSIFTNPRTPDAQLILLVPDNQLVFAINRERTTLEPVLAETVKLAADTNPTSVDANITAMIASAQTVASFLDQVVTATSKAIPTSAISAGTIASDQTIVSAARTETIAAIGSLTTAKTAYDAAVFGATTAATSANAGTSSDIASAKAGVQSALGTLDAAKANLEKTIIRSPISGTIVSLPITKGQYVSAMSSVAQVSNPNALEVDAYLTASEAKLFAVGDKATINGEVHGTIVFIAPALDPTTGKVEIKIGLSSQQQLLTDGDTVRVTLTRSITSATSTHTTTASTTETTTIPIIAAKITPTGPVVFTVSSSTLVAHPVIFGPILGDTVTISTSLPKSTPIVTDARGLSEGQKVVVNTAP